MENTILDIVMCITISFTLALLFYEVFNRRNLENDLNFEIAQMKARMNVEGKASVEALYNHKVHVEELIYKVEKMPAKNFTPYEVKRLQDMTETSYVTHEYLEEQEEEQEQEAIEKENEDLREQNERLKDLVSNLQENLRG